MKESDIRPKELFDEHLRLNSQDIDSYFSKERRIAIPCPACNRSQNQFAFKINGFDFVECNACRTLYLSPRPPLDEFEKYYSNATSAHFWVKKLYPAVIESRRNKIFRPNVEKIHSICHEKQIKVKVKLEINELDLSHQIDGEIPSI